VRPAGSGRGAGKGRARRTARRESKSGQGPGAAGDQGAAGNQQIAEGAARQGTGNRRTSSGGEKRGQLATKEHTIEGLEDRTS